MAIGALQGKTVSVPLSVSMTAASDTGISNSDGITKNRSPQVSGVAMPSATVTLYANNQIVGSTISASNGQWSVTSQELADGNYDLSVSIQTVQGAMIQQKVKTITIDTAAPQIASVTGLMDGVAWDPSDVFSGSLRDADNQTQLQYWIDNGAKQTIGLTNNASNLNFNNIALSQISNLSANSEHKLYLKAVDRAGNETQYDYSFMRLDLPELTEDTDWTGPVNGGEDDRTGSGSGFTGGALPSGAGGYYYIGAGGAWGYSSGSGGGGDWNPANFGGSNGSPALPTKPGQDPNEQLTYLQALGVILNTAVDALSKHSSVVSKKQVLGEFKSDLLAMGKVIEFYGLHESFKTEFNELFSLGYDKTDDRVSWQEAVMAGWKFAKSVALDSKPVRLKAFESQLFGMVRGMMVRENISLSVIQEQELKQTLETFSRRYAVLNPARSQYSWNSYYSGFEEMIWGIGIRGRVSGRWSWNSGPMFSNGPAIENGWLGWDSFNHLQRLVTGLNAQQIINGFENTHTLISGATRTAPLWRSGAAHVRFGEFLNKLMETGFTLTRVGATNPAGFATSSSAWLEGILEKNVQLVAGGLGQFFQGLDATSSYWGWGDRPYTNIFADTLDYAQRLMKAAAAVDDPLLDAEVLKADVLSELINLGSSYSKLNAYNQSSSTLFLNTINTKPYDIDGNSQQLENFLKASSSNAKATFSYQKRLLTIVGNIDKLKSDIKGVSRIEEIIEAGFLYQNIQNQYNTSDVLDSVFFITDNIYQNAYYADSRKDLMFISNRLNSQFSELFVASNVADQNIITFGFPDKKKSRPFLDFRNVVPMSPVILSMSFLNRAPNKQTVDNAGPLETRNVTTIQNYIKLMELEEKRSSYNQFDSRNTKDMITRFRQLYYSGQLWDRLIIPNTENISPIFERDGSGKPVIPSKWLPTPRADLGFGISQVEVFRPDSRPEIVKSQEIRDADGNYLDIGHTLVAMDAVNRPSIVTAVRVPFFNLPVPILDTLEVDSNIDNSTWLGDLGGIIRTLVNSEKTRPGEVQDTINDEAEYQDLLGNVDGLVISYHFKDKMSEVSNGETVSKIFKSYYTPSGNLRASRFTTFARIIGLGEIKGDDSFTGGSHLFNQGDWFKGENKFTDEQQWIDYYADQLTRSAAQFVSGDLLKRVHTDPRKISMAFSQLDAAKTILKVFIRELKREIKSEKR